MGTLVRRRAMTNKTVRFLDVLADVGEPVPTYIVARRSRLTMRDCSHISARLVARDQISRVKPNLSEGGGYYRYFLNDEQRERYYRLAGVNPHFGIEGVDAVGLVDRLRFLRMLKERTIYRDSVVLDAILADYDRALNSARARE